MITAWQSALELAAQASSDLMSTCLQEEWRLGCLPHAIGNAVVLCHGAMSTGIVHFRHFYPGQHLPLPLDISGTLEGVRALLAGSGYELSALLERTTMNVEEYAAQLRRMRHDQDDQGEVPEVGPEGNEAGWRREMTGMTTGAVGETIMLGADVDDLFAGLNTWWDWGIPSNQANQVYEGVCQ